MEDNSLQTSVGVAMKALANLFQDSNDNHPAPDRVNPRDILLGLSVLFKKIAMASESNAIDELERGPRDSLNSRLEPDYPFDDIGRSEPLYPSQSVGPGVEDAVSQSSTDAGAPPDACEMGISAGRTNENWNPREFLENKHYTKLELDALKDREFFPPNVPAAENNGSSDLDILNRLCERHFTKDDLDTAFLIHEKDGWILNAKLRTYLFSEINVPMPQAYNQNTWHVLHRVSVDSRITLLRQFQGFILNTLSIASKNTVGSIQLPSVRYFVEDAIILLQILNMPASLPSGSEGSDPFKEFSRRRKDSWNERWNACAPDLVEEWQDYICGLCDALFGLWPASGPGSFHKTDGATGCIWTLLRAFIHVHRDPSTVPHIDYHRLDAAYIESRGPFRLKGATCIDDHLLITEKNEIMFYPDWKRWACLTSLNVLHHKSNLSLFDALMCARRRAWRPQPVSSQIRTSLAQLFGDLATTGMLFFFQENIPLDPKKQSRTRNSWLKRFHTFAAHYFPGHSSEKIAKRIGVPMSDNDLDVARAFLECCNNDWARLVNETTLFRTHSPFKDRLDKLHDELKTWTPKTVWEMRYAGYGGVDPVGLYAFYFAGVLGIATMIGLGIGIAQTFAAFKALP